PFTAKKMIHMMKVVDKMLEWENAGKTKLLSIGYSLRAPELLFRKIEDAEISFQVDKLKNNNTETAVKSEPENPGSDKLPANQPGSNFIDPVKPVIQYDDFSKLDLKIGTVISAE